MEFIFLTHTGEKDVVSISLASHVTLRIDAQSTSDGASTRKRIARSIFFQAHHYRQILSCYSLFNAENFEDKHFDLQSADARLLGQSSSGTNDSGRWRSGRLFFSHGAHPALALSPHYTEDIFSFLKISRLKAPTRRWSFSVMTPAPPLKTSSSVLPFSSAPRQLKPQFPPWVASTLELPPS